MSIFATRAAKPAEMTLGEFRRFQSERPDEERWELIEGVPFMMTPPYIAHNVIAGNMQELLNGVFYSRKSGRLAVQRIGVDLGIEGEFLRSLGKAGRYAPEPDLAVIYRSPERGIRYAERVFVFVEVVSATDDERELVSGLPWIEAKTRLYKAHAHCEAVVVIECSRVEIRVALRSETGWRDLTLTDVSAPLELPSCGFAGVVGDVYQGTHLDPLLSGDV